MNSRTEHESSQTIKQIKKHLSKQANSLAYIFLSQNPIKPKAFALLKIVKLAFLLIIPIQFFLNQIQGVGNSEDTLENQANILIDLFNYEHYDLIEVFASAFIILTSLHFLVAIAMVKIDISVEQSRSYIFYQSLQVELLLTGTTLFAPILSIQLLTLRCNFSSSLCEHSPPAYLLVLNLLDLLLLFLLQEANAYFNRCYLPLASVPWSKPKNALSFVGKYIPLAMGIMVATEDLLLEVMNAYVVLSVLVLITSAHLAIKIFYINYHSNLVSAIDSFSGVCLWVSSLSCIELELFDSSGSEYIVSILVCCTVLFLTAFLVAYKEHRLLQNYLDDAEPTAVALRNRILMHMALFHEESVQSNLYIKQFFIKHYKQCKQEGCPCKGGQPIQQYQEVVSQSFAVDISINEENDLLVGKKEELREKRLKLIFKILFFQSTLKAKNCTEIKALEIFVQFQYYHIYYASMFKLITNSSKFHHSSDKQVYFLLRAQVIERILRLEQQQGREYFNLEFQLSLERKFSEYQSQLLATTIVVEKLWHQLLQQNFAMREFLRLGFDVVDKYLKLRQFSESILEESPNFLELISLNVQFYTQVLNFEQEARLFYEMLVRIQQQFKVEKYNFYSEKNENDVGMVLVKCTRKAEQTITLSNKILNSLLKFGPNELVGRNISVVIPSIFHKAHEDYILDYLQEETNKFQMASKRHVWILNSYRRIIPVLIQVKTFVSMKQGFFLGAFFHPLQNEVGYQYGSKHDSGEVMLLTDDKGYIQNISRNCSKKYQHLCSMVDDEININIEDLFQRLKVQKLGQVPTEGVDTKLLLNYSEMEQLNPKYQRGRLKVTPYDYKGNIQLFELIFTEEPDEQNDDERQSVLMKSNLHLVNEREKLLRQAIDQGHSLNFNETHSSSSSIATSVEQRLKGEMDVNSTPQSIKNMRLAFVLFFAVLLVTSITILVTSIQQQRSFKSEMENLHVIITISTDIAGFRLALSNLVNYLHEHFPYDAHPEATFEFYVEQCEGFYYEMKENLGLIQQDQQDTLEEIKTYLYSDILKLGHLDQNGLLYFEESSFVYGLMSYSTLADSYLQKDESTLKSSLGTFEFFNIPSKPTIAERDLYFLDYNGLHVFEDISKELEELYILDATNKSDQFQAISLIVCMLCMAATIASSLFLIPALWKLDKEQEKIIAKWLQIARGVQQQVLANIEEFGVSFVKGKQTRRYREAEEQQEQSDDVKGEMELGQAVENEQVQVNDVTFNYRRQDLRQSREFQIDRSISHDQESEKLRSGLSQNLYQCNSSIDQNSSLQSMITRQNQPLSMRNSISLGVQQQQQKKKNEEEETKQEEQGEEMTLESKVNMLSGIYYKKKLKKVALLLLYCLFIVGYNVGSYFLASHLINITLNSFHEYQVSSSRSTCSANSIYFAMETFARNESIYTGFNQTSAFSYIHTNCTNLESEYDSMIKGLPAELSSINSLLIDYQSSSLCTRFPDIFALQQGNQTCEEMESILGKGLQSSVSYVLYHTLSEIKEFDGTPQDRRTMEFLHSHEFDDNMVDLSFLGLAYLMPVLKEVTDQVEEALASYIERQEKYFIVLFAIYTTFLVASLVVAVKVIISKLQMEVFRSRVLLKLIPTQELERIGQSEVQFKDLNFN